MYMKFKVLLSVQSWIVYFMAKNKPKSLLVDAYSFLDISRIFLFNKVINDIIVLLLQIPDKQAGLS